MFRFLCALYLLQILYSPQVISTSSTFVFSSTLDNSIGATVTSSVYSTPTISPTVIPSSSTTPLSSSTTTSTTTSTAVTTTPAPTNPPNQVSTCYAYPSLTNPCVKLCLKHSERIVLNIQYDDTNGRRREFLTGVPQNTSVSIDGNCAKQNNFGKSLSRISLTWPLNRPYSYEISFCFKRNDKDFVSSGKTSYKGTWWLSDLKLHYSNASYDPMFIDPILNSSTVSISNAQTFTNVKYSYYCSEELELTLSNSTAHSSIVQFSMGEYILQAFNMTSPSFSATHVCNTEEEEEEVINMIAVGVATGLAVLVGVILVGYIAGRIWNRKKQASSYEVLA
ncbi:hypothetical protein LOD99_14712 [Oopsacas minuta]|uniref:Lysosome-associated membrane glycoprotein 1 n=1 Tax=Oopsacas minuta TaxID=111878 RepID=A0AAV7KF94_9METZ|nr:hypothetical protein LOD99_14712 [Oopsacas minuta]